MRNCNRPVLARMGIKKYSATFQLYIDTDYHKGFLLNLEVIRI